MIIKAEPYKRGNAEKSNEKQRAMNLKSQEKKLHSLQLSKQKVEKLVKTFKLKQAVRRAVCLGLMIRMTILVRNLFGAGSKQNYVCQKAVTKT